MCVHPCMTGGADNGFYNKVFKHLLLKETEKKGVTVLQNINSRADFSITGSSKFYLHVYDF